MEMMFRIDASVVERIENNSGVEFSDGHDIKIEIIPDPKYTKWLVFEIEGKYISIDSSELQQVLAKIY